ncbi:hypothetical protein DL769_010643 [Monosporascus sp. CRB-8-3]|nr:hypothetical protein DL769_010643 [Monosporascus sp. CRB-8-3]
MKFLSGHSKTRLHLERWAGNKRLLLASCFFWYAGARLQESQEGLLRSLLFEIVRQRPEIAPLVRDLRIELGGYEDQVWSWTHADLLYVCRKVVEACTDVAFCFIDGLDEYGEDGMAPIDFVKTIRQLASYPNVRMCVSSRPWPDFVDAFSNYPDLKLEDLTPNDILRYVKDNFDQSVPFQGLKDTDPAYPTLPRRICSQAQGVFLWIYLVVRDLLDGLTHGEPLHSLLDHLNGLLKDLDEFFQHMIDTIKPPFIRQTARTLEMTISTEQPLSMIAYSCVDDAESDPNFSLHVGSDAMPEAEVKLQEDLMRRRLSGRCKGLLEITSDEDTLGPYFQLKVDLIHRTVSEFLHRSTSVQSLIQSHTENSSTTLLLCRAIVAEIKRAPFRKFMGVSLIS